MQVYLSASNSQQAPQLSWVGKTQPCNKLQPQHQVQLPPTHPLPAKQANHEHIHTHSHTCRLPMVTQPVCRPKYVLEKHSTAPTSRPATSARTVSTGPPASAAAAAEEVVMLGKDKGEEPP